MPAWFSGCDEFISPGGWGGGNLARIDDDTAIPTTPVVTWVGPAGFPVDALTFHVSAFDDPQGWNTFGALQWRIAEVSPHAQVVVPEQRVVLVPESTEWRYRGGWREPSVPSDLVAASCVR